MQEAWLEGARAATSLESLRDLERLVLSFTATTAASGFKIISGPGTELPALGQMLLVVAGQGARLEEGSFWRQSFSMVEPVDGATYGFFLGSIFTD